MMKKIIVLSVFAVMLTGCVVSPYDDDYPRDGRNHSGQYDRDHRWDHNQDRKDRPDWKNQHRYGKDDDRRSDHRHPH